MQEFLSMKSVQDVGGSYVHKTQIKNTPLNNSICSMLAVK